jgi:hypothetical protein
MKRNRLILLPLVVIALIYFFNDKKELSEDKNQSSAIDLKSKIDQEIPKSNAVQDKISNKLNIAPKKNSLKNMTLQEAYCHLKKLDAKIPMTTKSKFSGYYGPELLPSSNGDLHTGEPIITMAILDKECPKNKYSIFKARQTKGKWNIEKILNCKRVSNEELFSEYGLQYTIKEADRIDPTIFNFAMNGPGLFITSCRQDLVLTRLGKYKLNSDGHIENKNGCLLLNKSLRPIKILPGDELSEQEPCFSEPNQCLAILNRDDLPKFKGQLIAPFEFRISLRDQTLLKKRLTAPNHFPSDVFSHYSENLMSKDILPSGISTKSFESFNEDFSCSQNL